MNDSCIFCDILRNDPKEQIKGSMHIGSNLIKYFEPLNPCTKGHLLFVPHQHVGDASQSPTTTGDAVAAATLFAKYEGISDYNIIINCGVEASQTISHLHVHLVPRVAGDYLKLPWEQHQQKD